MELLSLPYDVFFLIDTQLSLRKCTKYLDMASFFVYYSELFHILLFCSFYYFLDGIQIAFNITLLISILSKLLHELL